MRMALSWQKRGPTAAYLIICLCIDGQKWMNSWRGGNCHPVRCDTLLLRNDKLKMKVSASCRCLDIDVTGREGSGRTANGEMKNGRVERAAHGPDNATA